MGINDLLLVIAALLPAIILCIYIFKKDRVEKEPIGLLINLFLLGALCCYPAAWIEEAVIGVIDKCFSGFAYQGADGSLLMPTGVLRFYNLLKYFLGVALIEEGLKFLTLIFVTGKSKEFNSLFDGLVYAIFVSLGFAALENVFYVLEYGWMNALSRAFLSVPGHMFFAVMMGYHYSIWHVTDKAGYMERSLQEAGAISASTLKFSSKKSRAMCILIPVIAHGIYNYCCTYGTKAALFVFYAFVIFMYIYCFGKIKKMSLADAPDCSFAKAMLIRKYSELAEATDSEFSS